MATATVRATSTASPFKTELSNGTTHRWVSDEPAGLGGGDTGPSPTELMLSSLCACTSITLQMYAARKQWSLISVEVGCQLNPAGASNEKTEPGHNHITREITLLGNLHKTQRERLLQIANACPMHKLLTGSVDVTSYLT